jgi:hypothetical protein
MILGEGPERFMAASLRRLGLVVNPAAGRGAKHNLAIAARAMATLRPQEIITGPRELGAEAFDGDPFRDGARPRVAEVTVSEQTGRARTTELVRRVLEHAPDAIVVVGGDGTLADAATVLVDERATAPILGIGVGSTNVGPLVAADAASVDRLGGVEFVRRPLHALEVSLAGDRLGVAFHDVVVGYTVVGTIDGRAVDVDARALFEGSTVPGQPRSVGAPTTRITRIGRRGSEVVAAGGWVGTIVVAAVRDELVGQALAGGACLAALTGIPAGCLVSERPLALVGLSSDEVLAWPPLKTAYVNFDDQSTVLIEGVAPGAAVSADGNPLRILGPGDEIEVRLRPNAAFVIRIGGTR